VTASSRLAPTRRAVGDTSGSCITHLRYSRARSGARCRGGSASRPTAPALARSDPGVLVRNDPDVDLEFGSRVDDVDFIWFVDIDRLDGPDPRRLDPDLPEFLSDVTHASGSWLWIEWVLWIGRRVSGVDGVPAGAVAFGDAQCAKLARVRKPEHGYARRSPSRGLGTGPAQTSSGSPWQGSGFAGHHTCHELGERGGELELGERPRCGRWAGPGQIRGASAMSADPSTSGDSVVSAPGIVRFHSAQQNTTTPRRRESKQGARNLGVGRGVAC
jgi:hypothetical protein